MPRAEEANIDEPAPGAAAVLPDDVLDALPDGVFAVDAALRVTLFNRAAVQIAGVPRAQAIGARCADVFPARDHAFAAIVRRALEGGRPVVNQALYLDLARGERRPVSVSVGVLDGADGARVAVGAFRDLTGVFERYLSGGAVDARGDLRKQLLQQRAFADIVSRNHQMREVFAILPDVARSPSGVLIEGPGGAGKELLARAIHRLGPRRERPLVVVSCAGMDETRLLAELFGHVAGAFPGARRARDGRVAQARGGTLFLDEVGALPASAQVRLLRVLQEGRVEPLGEQRARRVDVRVIAATRHDLEARVRAGSFREDLFYRLGVVRLTVPALADRREDIPPLVDHSLARLRSAHHKEVTGVTPSALDALLRHDYPGNVRELESAVEFAFMLCPDGAAIGVEHLPARLLAAVDGVPAPRARSLRELEGRYLREALASHDHNISATARALGIHRTTLWRRMRKLGIERPSS